MPFYGRIHLSSVQRTCVEQLWCGEPVLGLLEGRSLLLGPGQSTEEPVQDSSQQGVSAACQLSAATETTTNWGA